MTGNVTVAPVVLPRINAALSVVDQNGRPTVAFKKFEDTLASNVEDAFTGIIANVGAIAAAQASAAAAQDSVDQIASAPLVVWANVTGFPNASLLEGGVGVTIANTGNFTGNLTGNLSGNITITDSTTISVNALTILNAAPVVLTQPLECPSIKIDETPAASTTASDHSIPINCNGTTYYMRLSTTP